MDTDFTEIGSRLRSLGTAIGKRQTIVDAFCGKEVDDKNVAKSAGDAHRHDAFSVLSTRLASWRRSFRSHGVIGLQVLVSLFNKLYKKRKNVDF
ncbi:hypothetical protein V500_00032 [Pseudogymnoascus sp. VKM F-4518 (FW-2643)]|nr:hypothetical protein V500_00032 [Pseudogymnoascus sp. VKM F-4518 (FW-2643)]